MVLKEGMKAPDFKLDNQSGKAISLFDFMGQWVLLYFYPKDDTPGCTTEACSLRDNLANFNAIDVKILGLSVDSVNSHKKFADKYDLNFDLLADDQKKVVELYGVWGKKFFMGKEFVGTLRKSFLIDPQGNIAKIYHKVKPAEHVAEVLNDLKDIQ